MYNTFLFFYIYGDIGHILGIFAVLFQRFKSAVETIWFCPMLISIMYLYLRIGRKFNSDVNLIDFEVKLYSFKKNHNLAS